MPCCAVIGKNINGYSMTRNEIAFFLVCVCVFVCVLYNERLRVRERERKCERMSEERERERERERNCSDYSSFSHYYNQYHNMQLAEILIYLLRILYYTGYIKS